MALVIAWKRSTKTTLLSPCPQPPSFTLFPEKSCRRQLSQSKNVPRRNNYVTSVTFVLLYSLITCHFLEFVLPHPAQKKGPLRDIVFWDVEDRPECVLSKCPKPRGKEWRRLQKLCCPDDTGVLHCQLDEDDKIQMMCIDPPELCPPGKFNN